MSSQKFTKKPTKDIEEELRCQKNQNRIRNGKKDLRLRLENQCVKMPLGYDIKEEATEIKTDLKNSRNTFLVLLLAGVGAYLARDRINDWWESRKDEEEE